MMTIMTMTIHLLYINAMRWYKWQWWRSPKRFLYLRDHNGHNRSHNTLGNVNWLRISGFFLNACFKTCAWERAICPYSAECWAFAAATAGVSCIIIFLVLLSVCPAFKGNNIKASIGGGVAAKSILHVLIQVKKNVASWSYGCRDLLLKLFSLDSPHLQLEGWRHPRGSHQHRPNKPPDNQIKVQYISSFEFYQQYRSLKNQRCLWAPIFRELRPEGHFKKRLI